jgi:hypothetical protein
VGEEGATVAVAPSTPFRLTRSSTTRGQAFDKAAIGVMSNKIETQALTDMETITAQTPDDPAATKEALEQYRLKVRGELPLELKAPFDDMVQRHALAHVREASRNHTRKLNDEAEASFLEAYEAKRTGLAQLARRSGIDEEGDAELQDDVTTARVLSGFEARATPEERSAYFNALQATYVDGEGPAKDLSPESFARISVEMQQVMNRDETQRLKEINAAERLLDDATARVKKGFALPDNERVRLRSQVETLNDPVLQNQFQFFEELSNWQATARQQPPQVIEAQIKDLKSRMDQSGANEREIAALDVMQGVHKSVSDGLKDDPLGWAAQVGRIAIEPLDLSSGAAFQQTLAARADDARAVAQTYGIAPKFFRPKEAEALTKAISENPDLLLEFGPTLRETLGERDTPRAFAEISKEAAVIAHVSGLAMATGDDTFLYETTQALRLRAVPDHTPIVMTPETRPKIPALMALPGTEAAATKTAELVFDYRARAQGLDPKANPETAAELWQQTMSEAMGQHEDENGFTVGGIGLVNGFQTLLPSDMSAETLQNRMDVLDFSTLQAQMPFGSSNGIPITTAEIAAAKLVAAAPNRYRVALGDPASQTPRYIMAEGGGFWEIDVSKLRDTARMPQNLPPRPIRNRGIRQ